MKIFVVYSGHKGYQSHTSVDEIFSTRELAQEYIDYISEILPHNKYKIETSTMDRLYWRKKE